MSVQRYVVRGCNSDGWHTEKTKEYPDMQGRWVLFKDHQSSLAEREQQIAKLEAALEKIANGASIEWVWKVARAALATEGEKRE